MSRRSTSTWTPVLLGPDTPWLCPDCHDHFVGLDHEAQVMFLIGLSPEGANHLRGATFRPSVPPRGAICRHCWEGVPAAED